MYIYKHHILYICLARKGVTSGRGRGAHTYIHTDMYVYIHICIYIDVCVCVCVCVSVYKYLYNALVHMFVCAQAMILSVQQCLDMLSFSHWFMHTDIYKILILIHIYICIYIFTYTNPEGINLNCHLEKEYDVGADKYM